MSLHRLALSVALWFACSHSAQATPFSFVEVASTTGGTFFGLTAPALENGKVAFAASTGFGSPNVIYSNLSGTLTPVADSSINLPGGSGFTSVGSRIALDGGQVAFQGSDGSVSGLYTGNGGPVAKLVDNTDTIPPANTETFQSFDRPSYQNGKVAFYAVDSTFFGKGIYTTLSGVLQTLADLTTPIPGGTGNFTNLNSRPVTDGTNATFAGNGDDGYAGLFSGTTGSLTKVVDSNDAAPSGTGNFTNFSVLAMENGKLSFIATDEAGPGIYSNLGGSLQAEFNTNTVIPQQAVNFGAFTYLAMNNGKLAFVGSAGFGANEGIYTNLGGTLEKVVARDDVIGGKTVQSVSLSEEALDGGQIAFRVGFDDGTASIFVASVVEPTVVQPESVAAELTTGSPITLGQTVNTPASDFSLQFDYKFTTTTGHLDVTLGGTFIGTLLAPQTLESDFSSASFDITGALLNQTGIPLEFTLDGPTGSKILLDNISFPGLANSNFESGSLSGWTTSGPGSAGTIQLNSSSSAELPEPSSLLLLSMLAGALAVRKNRRSRS